MDRQLFDAMCEKAVHAAMPRVMQLPAGLEPAHVYYLVYPNGTAERVEAEPPPRRHEAGDLMTVCRFAAEFAEANEVELWYSRDGVVAVLDGHARRDTVTMPLSLSAQLLALLQTSAGGADQGRGMARQEFLRLLRVRLAGAAPGGAAESFRRLEERAAAGEGLLEELTLEVPAWEGFQEESVRLEVRCVMEAGAAADRFWLTPLPGQIEAGLCEAERRLGSLVRCVLAEAEAELAGSGVEPDREVGVYYGWPVA